MKHFILSLCLVLVVSAADKPTPKGTPQCLGQPSVSRKIEAARTVKLEFEIKGDGGQTFLVLVRGSGGEYSINRSHMGLDNEHSWDFNGTVESVTDFKKVDFNYDAAELIKDINEDVEHSSALKGSAVLKTGQQTVLGFMGDRVLSVTATIVE